MSTAERAAIGRTPVLRPLFTVVAVFLLVGGCGQSADQEVAVNGVWSVTGDDIEAEVTYRPDGTYTIAPIVDGVSLPWFDFGAFAVEGNTLIYTSSDNALGCESGEKGSYRIDANSPTSFTLTLIEDQCERRSEGGPFVHTPTD